mgnify:CR=1 FL=1
MTINQLLQKLDTSSPILKATFGLERENLRVTTDGHLAQTAHPSQLGSRNFHPTIQTDFSEQQLELLLTLLRKRGAYWELSAMWQAAQLTRVNACGLCPCHRS